MFRKKLDIGKLSEEQIQRISEKTQKVIELVREINREINPNTDGIPLDELPIPLIDVTVLDALENEIGRIMQPSIIHDKKIAEMEKRLERIEILLQQIARQPVKSLNQQQIQSYSTISWNFSKNGTFKEAIIKAKNRIFRIDRDSEEPKNILILEKGDVKATYYIDDFEGETEEEKIRAIINDFLGRI